MVQGVSNSQYIGIGTKSQKVPCVFGGFGVFNFTKQGLVGLNTNHSYTMRYCESKTPCTIPIIYYIGGTIVVSDESSSAIYYLHLHLLFSQGMGSCYYLQLSLMYAYTIF